jgi:GntR family transcriptional regulator
LRIIISNASGKPIYEQIEDQIREAILSDELRDGDLLPSIRQLARDLRISVITTTRAYADLEKEGFIAIVQGKGCYVLPKNSELIREQLLRRVEENLAAAAGAAKTARLSKTDLIKILDMIMKENDYE